MARIFSSNCMSFSIEVYKHYIYIYTGHGRHDNDRPLDEAEHVMPFSLYAGSLLVENDTS